MTKQISGLAIAVSIVALFSFTSSAGYAQMLTRVDRVAVFDTNGARVGRVIGFDFDGVLPTVAFEANGRFFVLHARRDALVGRGGSAGKVRFDDVSCGNDGGLAYVGPPDANDPKSIFPLPIVAGNKVFVAADPNAGSVQIQLDSELLFDGTCQFINFVDDVVPAIVLVDLAQKFSPGFKMGPDTEDGTTALEQRVSDLETQGDTVEQDLAGHTHTYLTGKGKRQNRVEATTGTALLPP